MLFANIQPITMSFTPDNDITGFIIPIILFLTIASVYIIAALKVVYNKASSKIKATIKAIKYKIQLQKFNRFYDDIINNKILLSNSEIESIKNNFIKL